MAVLGLYPNKLSKYAFSGTLGDAFIVLCKLYTLHQKNGGRYELIRYSRWPEMDDQIKKLMQLTDFIKFIEPCKLFKTELELKNEIEKGNYLYINSCCKRTAEEKWRRDFIYLPIEPFPILDIEKWNFNSNKKHIGFQLHTGKQGGNYKAFSLNWIRKVLKFMLTREYKIHLFGTGDGFSKNKIKHFCHNHNIENHVGNTDFKQWVSMLSAMDFFITPEGFSAFFAMSQKVKTLVFYTDYDILGRVHPVWRKENIIMSAGWQNLPYRIYNSVYRIIRGRYPLLSPIKAEQVFSLLHSEYSCLERR